MELIRFLVWAITEGQELAELWLRKITRDSGKARYRYDCQD